MTERHDEPLDRLLHAAATAQRFEPTPDGLAQRLEARLQARTRRRCAGLALAAMLALAASVGLPWLSEAPVTPPIALQSDRPAIVPDVTPAGPAVRVDLPDNVLARQIDTGDPGVTVLWLYPTVRATADAGPQLNQIDPRTDPRIKPRSEKETT